MPEVKLMRLVVGDCGGLKQAREALYCGGRSNIPDQKRDSGSYSDHRSALWWRCWYMALLDMTGLISMKSASRHSPVST